MQSLFKAHDARGGAMVYHSWELLEPWDKNYQGGTGLADLNGPLRFKQVLHAPRFKCVVQVEGTLKIEFLDGELSEALGALLTGVIDLDHFKGRWLDDDMVREITRWIGKELRKLWDEGLIHPYDFSPRWRLNAATITTSSSLTIR